VREDEEAMFERLASFAKSFNTAMQNLASKVFGRLRNEADEVSDPDKPRSSETEPSDQPGRDFLHEAGEELKRQSELMGRDVGGPAIEAEKKINAFAHNIQETNSLLKWAGRNGKAVWAIAIAATVALFAGVKVAHFDGFDHPLASPPAETKTQNEMEQLQRMNQMTVSLNRHFAIQMSLSQADSQQVWRNLSDLAQADIVPLPPQIHISPELAQLPVHVQLKALTYVRSYEDVVASFPRSSQRQINDQIEKAGTHIEVHLTGVQVPNNAPDYDQTHQGPPAGWHWEVLHTSEVVPNK
jgi:hypothetical protein